MTRYWILTALLAAALLIADTTMEVAAWFIAWAATLVFVWVDCDRRGILDKDQP